MKLTELFNSYIQKKQEANTLLERQQCEAFNKAYPEAYAKLKTVHPDLTEQERDLLVLNFLGFRIKEEAEILGLSQNTVMKYRSSLIKKAGKSPVADLIG